MMHCSPAARAGILASLRGLVRWNKSNAAATLARTPQSDDAPVDADTAALSAASPSSSSVGAGSVSPCVKKNGASDANQCGLADGGSRAASAHSPLRQVPTSALDGVEAAVRHRWSCRHFDASRTLDKALLERILAATTRSPTGYNLQPWVAVVVHEPAQKQALFRAALGQRQVLVAPATVVFAGDPEVERYAPQVLEQGLEDGSIGPAYGPVFLRNVFYHLHGGPLQSMAIAKTVLSGIYSRQTATPLLSVPISMSGYAAKQTMIPATTFVNLASAAGLDTCMMEGIDEEATKKVVGLPSRFVVPVIISVGYAAEGDGAGGPRRPKTPRLATSHSIRWGTY